MNLPITPDPFPDRNVFIRSDQYSFIRAGIPALFFKYGFKAGTPEATVERAWRANIYHSPKDDANQPVMPAESVKLNDYVAAVRSEEHTPELQSLMRISYAVFCLKKKNKIYSNS